MCRVNAVWSSWLWACLLAGVPLVAGAQVYRCTAANGSIAYQDRPCVRGQRQTVLDLPARAPAGDMPPPVAATVAAPVDDEARLPPAYTPPPAPLPVMYACIGAVNSKRYLSAHPTPSYLAPLGVLGYPPRPLAQAYGARGGGGVSAPEAAPRPRIGGPSIAAGMAEVEDDCLPASHAEVCALVRHEYDENHRQLRIAMRSGQPPLRQREAQLLDQLRNCR